MALDTSPPLEEVRAAVEVRLGARPNSDQRLTQFLNEEIRGAHTRLYRRHWWARRRLLIPIDLIVDQPKYDIPDQLQPQFEHVWVEDENSRIVELVHSTPSPAMRDALLRGTDENGDSLPSTPTTYWFENDLIHIGPYPDVEVWKHMVVQGMERETEVARDGQRIRIDRELLVMHVVRAARDAYGEDSSKIMNDIMVYEADLMGDAGDRETFSLGQTNGQYYNKAVGGRPDAYGWHPGNRLFMRGR